MKTYRIGLMLLLVLVIASCKKKDKEESDFNGPVVTLNGATEISVPFGQDTPDPGAKAVDEKDGEVAVTSDWGSKVNKNMCGDYFVTYSAADKNGNKGEKVRKVTVKLGGGSYLGVYTTTFAVVGGGQSVTTTTVVAGANPNQFIVNYYLGPGGDPFTVNVSGVLGNELSIVTTTGPVGLSGGGHSENNGNKIVLSMYQNVSLNVICTMVKQ